MEFVKKDKYGFGMLRCRLVRLVDTFKDLKEK